MQFYTDETGRLNGLSDLDNRTSNIPDEIDEDNFFNYVYRDGEFIYDPIPEEETDDRTVDERLAALETITEEQDSMLSDMLMEMTLSELGLEDEAIIMN